MYEVIPGTTLAHICRLEKGVPGLGGSLRHAHLHFHPLTTSAAGTLLGQPRLGRDPSGTGHRVGAHTGQRLYFLEVPGTQARVVTSPGGRALRRRSSVVRLTLDFIRRQARVTIFLSEADAQEIAVTLRKPAGPAAILPSLAKRVVDGVRAALAGTGHIRIIHPRFPGPLSRTRALKTMPPVLLARLGEAMEGWVIKELSELFERQPQTFLDASGQRDDGVTVKLVLDAPRELAALRAALSGKPGALEPGGRPDARPAAQTEIQAGWCRGR